MIFPAILGGIGKSILGSVVAGGVGKLFGSKPQTTTSEQHLPKWLEDASKGAIGRAETLSNRPYQAYTGERFAPLTPWELRGQGLADSRVGAFQPWITEAADMTRRGGMSFLDADINAYMNPFIKNALNPAIRDTSEYFTQKGYGDNAMAASRGAFGGSRHAMMDQTRLNAEGRAIGDIYSQGYAGAFDRGADAFFRDRDASSRTGAQLAGLAQTGSALDSADIDRLYKAGGIQRELEQAGKDFDYMQFIEGRDWDVNNLNILLKALGAVPYGQKNTQTLPAGSPLAQGVGALTAGYGLFGPGGPFGGGGGGGGGAFDKTGYTKTVVPSGSPPPNWI